MVEDRCYRFWANQLLLNSLRDLVIVDIMSLARSHQVPSGVKMPKIQVAIGKPAYAESKQHHLNKQQIKTSCRKKRSESSAGNSYITQVFRHVPPDRQQIEVYHVQDSALRLNRVFVPR